MRIHNWRRCVRIDGVQVNGWWRRWGVMNIGRRLCVDGEEKRKGWENEEKGYKENRAYWSFQHGLVIARVFWSIHVKNVWVNSHLSQSTSDMSAKHNHIGEIMDSKTKTQVNNICMSDLKGLAHSDTKTQVTLFADIKCINKLIFMTLIVIVKSITQKKKKHLFAECKNKHPSFFL